MGNLARNTSLILLAGFLLFGSLLSLSARFLTDWWWVVSLGQLPVLLTRLGWEWGIRLGLGVVLDRKSTRLNSSHVKNSYAVFCLTKIKLVPGVALPRYEYENTLLYIDNPADLDKANAQLQRAPA